MSEELGDVQIFLIQLSDILGIDLYQATREKIKTNRRRTWPHQQGEDQCEEEVEV